MRPAPALRKWRTLTRFALSREEETFMSKLHLTFACGPYDRTLALRDGTIQPEGILHRLSAP